MIALLAYGLEPYVCDGWAVPAAWASSCPVLRFSPSPSTSSSTEADMALPLIPLLGPLLIKGAVKALPGRFAETWAPRIGKLLALAIAAALLWLAINAAIGAIRTDARDDLLAEQAERQRLADEAQRIREAAAQGERDAALAAGAETDAEQQKEITDATQDLPDSRPTARQRSRVCVELQQQDRAAGRAPRSC